MRRRSSLACTGTAVYLTVRPAVRMRYIMRGACRIPPKDLSCLPSNHVEKNVMSITHKQSQKEEETPGIGDTKQGNLLDYSSMLVA